MTSIFPADPSHPRVETKPDSPHYYCDQATEYLQDGLNALRWASGHGSSREISLAITQTQQALHWMGEERQAIFLRQAEQIAKDAGISREIDELCSMLGPLVTSENHEQVHQLLSFYYTSAVD